MGALLSAPPSLLLHDVFHHLAKAALPLAPFPDRLSVAAFLTRELPVTREARGIECAAGDRRLHCAARLVFVMTISEAAARCQFSNVREDFGDAVGDIHELEFAHTGRVDQPAAGRETMHGTVRGRVAPVRIVFADASSRDAGSGERVHQCRFADAG